MPIIDNISTPTSFLKRYHIDRIQCQQKVRRPPIYLLVVRSANGTKQNSRQESAIRFRENGKFHSRPFWRLSSQLEVSSIIVNVYSCAQHHKSVVVPNMYNHVLVEVVVTHRQWINTNGNRLTSLLHQLERSVLFNCFVWWNWFNFAFYPLSRVIWHSSWLHFQHSRAK